MGDWQTDPLWYKDAIIYQLHVKAFFDSNGDGVGDFVGLTQKLDYIQALGVNAIWLLPFYPSPMRDDGYDIADYRNIHPEYGTRREFRQFVREAHARGIKVITELVINHTSDQHPWFQAARRAPKGSARRNFYVWSDDDKKFAETRIIFTDTEPSNWAWDLVAKQYYWHRFFSHQPDLNHNNPAVVKAVIRVMRFWLDMGVDGMRLDAIPYLCVREGTNNENLPETHEVLRRMRATVDAEYQYRMFLAEANQWPEDVRDYFGDGDECHMAYHFPLMPRMYMAIAQEDRHPITEIMGQTPEIPASCQWAIFLRNHDELTLEMVTDRERDYMYQTYAIDKRMRINVGIRRRFAPLMDNDMDKIRLMNSLLMSMPGAPIIYYGDEIGMGDNIFLGDRNGVRTPMQWSPDRNAGFSRADPQRLYLPPVMDPIYGYDAVNVEAQSREPSSLLNWMKRLIAVRKSVQAFGRGTLAFLRPGNRKILAYLRRYEAEEILCVANLSRTAQPVELDLGAFKTRVPVEMMGHSVFPPIGELPYLLTLPGYGVYWFRLTEAAPVPEWHEERLPPAELPVLVLFTGWKSLFPAQVEAGRRGSADRLRAQLVDECIPEFLRGQRWFAAKGCALERVEITQQLLWTSEEGTWLLLLLSVQPAGQPEQQLYFLPLTIVWEEESEKVWPLLHFTLAKVRQKSRVGLLCDGFVDEVFAYALVRAMREGRAVEIGGCTLRFSATAALDRVAAELPAEPPMRRSQAEASNTAVILGEKLFLKGYRRPYAGVNAELELGRFLMETSPFANIIPVYGALELETADGGQYTLALLQGYVKNQGDAWSNTVDYLQRYLVQCQIAPADPDESHASELALLRVLGVRTGELHRALARTTGDAAFDPEPMRARELESWGGQLRREATQTLDRVARQVGNLPERAQEDARDLVAGKESLLQRIGERMPTAAGVMKTRHHGDYHLGQVLVTENDVVIIDFEGEPARPPQERRQKTSPLRDVAGMLRSFSYAAQSALLAVTAETPDEIPTLEPFAQTWELLARQAFLDGYREAAEGSLAYPADPATAAALTDLYTLEKVLYELRYELDNRPDWIGIPIRGLLGFLAD